MKRYLGVRIGIVISIVVLLSACGGSSRPEPSAANELRVSVNTSAGGSASSSGVSVNTGGTFTVQFTPNAGFYLSEVTGCPGTLEGLTFTASSITSRCTLTAQFERYEYSINVTTTAGGSVDHSSLQVLHGDTPEIEFHPESDYRVASVQGCQGQLQDRIYTLDPVESDCDLLVSFEPRPAVQGDIQLRAQGQAIKTLVFEWQPQQWALEYRLYESQNGVDFELIGRVDNDVTRHEVAIPVHLVSDNVYRLEACNLQICEYSEAVAISNLEEAIGLLVPEKYTDQEVSNLGLKIALSGDGKVLAATLHGESCGLLILSGDLLQNPQQQCLDRPTGFYGDYYSKIALSHDGSVIAVSDALMEGGGGESAAGSVSIFVKGGAEWTLVDTLQPETPVESEYFGASMAISGDGSRLVVGGRVVYCGGCSPAFNSASTNRAFYYERDGDQWELAQIITDDDSHYSDYFGTSLSMSADGNWLTLGAQGYSGNTGKFYTYQYHEGAWQERWQTASPSDRAYQFFGRTTLSANGKTLFAIGGGTDYDGEVIYEYLMSDEGWELMNIIDPLGFSELGFGAYKPEGVSANGDYLVLTYHKTGLFYEGVGDDRHDWVAEGKGTLIVLSKQDGEWQEEAYLSMPYANEWQVYEFLPVGLSLDAKTLAVGVSLGNGVREVEDDFVYGPDTTNSDVSGEIYLF